MTGEELLAQADAAAANAYAPYSNYLVGAAALARDGRVFAGANVENAAYPLGICAERSAIAKAAGEGLRPGDLEAIAINASPCGGCRQWIHEGRGVARPPPPGGPPVPPGPPPPPLPPPA